MDLTKLFGSRSRVKLLEKFVIEDIVSDSKKGFFIRELCRDLDEQINAIRRELMNLETIGLLKSYEQNKKKYYMLNKKSVLYKEISGMFMKSYDALSPLKNFFKGRKNIDVVTVSDAIIDFNKYPSNNITDILVIGDLNSTEFKLFLEKALFIKKAKYLILSIDDFTKRLEYNDKVILTILSQPGNIFIRDRLGIQEIIDSKVRNMQIFHA